ncbi:MAG: VLRF1 family aeRF1-type release factor [Nitrospirota bacterium]|nr:VLRF1 family aeRF1-type release factor [Nitrospirota bacterium]
MISSEDIRRIRDIVAPYDKGPVLSLYADLDPSKPENAGKAYLLRAKQTLKAMGVQEPYAKKALECLDHALPFKKTRAMFVADELFAYFDFQVDLPIVDLAHGRLEARLGKPYVLPLLLALDEYKRYGVIVLSQERWRFLEVNMMEIEEIQEAFLTINREDWCRYTEAKPPSMIGRTGRGGSGKDLFDRRMLMWLIRFYKQAATLLERTIQEKGIERLILIGTHEEIALFESYLPKGLQQRVIFHATSLSNLEATPGEILHVIREEIVSIERKEEAALLEKIREEGVWGFEQTLEALQEGRIYLLAVPWKLSRDVFVCEDSRLALPSLELAEQSCPGDILKEDFKNIVVELAQSYGAGLEFFQGEQGESLMKEFGGLAGLKRW